MGLGDPETVNLVAIINLIKQGRNEECRCDSIDSEEAMHKPSHTFSSNHLSVTAHPKTRPFN